MKKIGFLLATAILALTMIAAAPAPFSGPLDGGPIILGGNYTVHADEVVSTDLIVVGGNVEVEEGGRVKGSIVIFGGNVTLNGQVDGDLVLIGGAGTLGEKAVVKGDAVSVGGSLSRAKGAQVGGDIIEEPAIQIQSIPSIPSIPAVPEVPGAPNTPKAPVFIFNPVDSAFGILGRAIGIAILAMLLMLFVRPQMERVAQTAVTEPVRAGGIGLLSLVLAPLAVGVMAITIILIPLALLSIPAFVLILATAWLFGIVALGMEVGERFTKAIDQIWSPVLTTGFGAFLLVMVSESVSLIPCVGLVASALLAFVGIGAVALTWFGTRGYPPLGAAPAPSASSEAPAVVS